MAQRSTSLAEVIPPCDRKFGNYLCEEVGEHVCEARARHIVGFFADVLVHTKGQWSRTPFRLAPWQRDDIMVPLFATVHWSEEARCYVRRYRIAWIEVGRKNGKALDIATPILTARGWTTMGELCPGDAVHAADGSLTQVQWVSDRHRRPSYRVRFADGAEIVAADDHKWLVNDRRFGASRVATTAELAESLHYGGRGDRRYSVGVPAALERAAADLPIDPYVLGAWLGDGTSSRAELTTPDPAVIEAFAAAGYAPSYTYERGLAVTQGFLDLVRPLRQLGVLGNKHVPAAYLTASATQRLELLRGLMDSDGCVLRTSNTPRVEFTSSNEGLARAVLGLARSLGWKATLRVGRAMLNGRDYGPKWRVCWTAWRDRSPFRLARKTDLLHEPKGRTRSHTNAIVAVEPVGLREVVCIAVEHPSHLFLAGESLTPTHNSELLAGIGLYLLCADDEEQSEVYGCARDRDQARKVFDVARRMVELSPVLSKRLKCYKVPARIVDVQTSSVYELVAADAAGNLGHNPHGILMDEVLAQRDGSLWTAMRTAMGARHQPLMVAATTAGDDPNSFGKAEHDEMVRISEDPSRAPHVFTYIRNLPEDADPFDETNWFYANPGLGDFKSVESLRMEAQEARNDPTKENGFRQFQLNQWVNQASRWMPMHLWVTNIGEPWASPDYRRRDWKSRIAFGGLDLAAKMDLTAWCLVLPGKGEDDPIDVLWRFWLPEAAVRKLDKWHHGKFARWVREGWIFQCDGEVIDYDQVVADIAKDAAHFNIRGVDADEWSMWPLLNKIADVCHLDVDDGELSAYRNSYDRMSPGMDDVMALCKTDRIRHHGNPVAEFCFNACDVKRAPYDANLLRPVKPDRGVDKHRIDAVPTLVMAINCMRDRLAVIPRRSAYADNDLMVV